MKKKGLVVSGILAAFSAALIFSPSYSHSAIYKWVDKNGQVHITDYHPGPEEMQGAGEEVVPDKPQMEAPETKTAEQHPAEEKSEASIPEQQQPQKTGPSPEPEQPAPPAALKPDTPSPFPSGIPGFPAGKGPVIAPGALAGLISFISGFFLFISIGFYLYFSACLYLIAKKLNVPAPFLAWVPLVQVWTFVVAAKGTDESPVLWIIGLIVPVVGFFVGIYLWMCVTERMGKDKWLGLLTLVPVVNFIFMGWLAFQKGSPEPSEEERFMQAVKGGKA
jgi:hypothetical protein